MDEYKTLTINMTRIKKIIIVVITVLAIAIFTKNEFLHQEETDYSSRVDAGDIVVYFVDVWQGDCAVIQTKVGNIIIDAGLYRADNYTVDDLISYIDSLEIKDFAYAVFTHPHSDHIGGAATVISKYDIGTVVIPDAVNTSTSFEKMLAAIEDTGCEVIEGKAGVSFTLGDVSIDLLAPVSNNYESLNNTSVVTKVTYGEVSFLFTGDAEELSELEMLERDYLSLDSTVLKVGHHGSYTSSCMEFIKAVSPEVAVFSCGHNNEYGHPHREVVNRINSIGATVYRTDKQGSIVIKTDGKEYSVYTEK